MYEIDKDVPMPEAITACKYPFHNMEVGDSFFVLLEKDQSLRKVQIAIAASIKHHHRKGLPVDARFATRQLEKLGGVRCWRIK